MPHLNQPPGILTERIASTPQGRALLLSFAQAEAETGIKVATWRAWAARRRVATVRMGRLVKLPASEITRLIEAGFTPALSERSSR